MISQPPPPAIERAPPLSSQSDINDAASDRSFVTSGSAAFVKDEGPLHQPPTLVADPLAEAAAGSAVVVADSDGEDEGRDHFDAEPLERQLGSAYASKKELRDGRKADAKLTKEEMKEKVGR